MEINYQNIAGCIGQPVLVYGVPVITNHCPDDEPPWALYQ